MRRLDYGDPTHEWWSGHPEDLIATGIITTQEVPLGAGVKRAFQIAEEKGRSWPVRIRVIKNSSKSPRLWVIIDKKELAARDKGFQSFMAKTLASVDMAEAESVEEARARWADEVWARVVADDKLTLALRLRDMESRNAHRLADLEPLEECRKRWANEIWSSLSVGNRFAMALHLERMRGGSR